MIPLAPWAASHAALGSGLAASISSAVRLNTLDGFAIGALLSGACFLVVTRSRRPRRPELARPALARPELARPELARPALAEPERAAAAGAHRSPPRWARTGRPRAEVGRMLPRHAAPHAGLASRMTGLPPSRDHAGSVS